MLTVVEKARRWAAALFVCVCLYVYVCTCQYECKEICVYVLCVRIIHPALPPHDAQRHHHVGTHNNNDKHKRTDKVSFNSAMALCVWTCVSIWDASNPYTHPSCDLILPVPRHLTHNNTRHEAIPAPPLSKTTHKHTHTHIQRHLPGSTKGEHLDDRGVGGSCVCVCE